MKFFKIIFVILVFLSCSGWTTKNNVDLGEFIKEITIINVKNNQTQSAIWLPFEFNASAIGSKSQVDISSLKSYLIFMVQCSDNRSGNQSFASWSQIQRRALLKTSSSPALRPMTLVPTELSQKLEMIRTAMAGENSAANMHMLVFDINDVNSAGTIDSTKRDKLTLILAESASFGRSEFVWHTPFDAVIDAGPCSKCGEKIKAQWQYCPWCGNKL